MNTPNPYATPDASLSTTGDNIDDRYEPQIFSFNGRIGRLRYLAYTTGINLAMMAITIPFMATLFAGLSSGGSISGIGSVFYVILNIASIVFVVVLGKRRLNDLNHSGWWQLLLFVPLINLILIIYMIFFAGTSGGNQYGPQAIPNSLGVKILGLLFPVLFVVGIVAAVVLPIMASVV